MDSISFALDGAIEFILTCPIGFRARARVVFYMPVPVSGARGCIKFHVLTYTRHGHAYKNASELNMEEHFWHGHGFFRARKTIRVP